MSKKNTRNSSLHGETFHKTDRRILRGTGQIEVRRKRSPQPFGSSGHLAQVVVVLFHFDHGLRFVLALFSLFAPMLAQRLSQQTTQQTSFIHDQTQHTPADVQVPDITPDAQTSPFSTLGLIAPTILIPTCALPLVSAPATVSQAQACLPAPSQRSKYSCANSPGKLRTVREHAEADR